MRRIAAVVLVLCFTACGRAYAAPGLPYYLALGDSLGRGTQPLPNGTLVDTNQGYVDGVYAFYRFGVRAYVGKAGLGMVAFTTRGVPGTHDLSLAFAAIAALERGETARLPRFDKASDDRLPEHEWTEAAKGTQVVLLEGWCIGAAPQDPQMLAEPVNELERDEDAELRWRGYANRMLERDYRTLFARIDYLAMLAAPG